MNAGQIWRSLDGAVKPILTPTLSITFNDYHLRWDAYIAVFHGALSLFTDEQARLREMMERASGGQRRWLRDRIVEVLQSAQELEGLMYSAWTWNWQNFLEQKWKDLRLKNRERERWHGWFLNTLSEARACRFYGELTLEQFMLHAANRFEFNPNFPWEKHSAKPTPANEPNPVP